MPLGDALACWSSPTPDGMKCAMNLTTDLTEILRIEHPILLAPMDVVATGELAAAVTDAGALGLIGGGYGQADWLDTQWRAAGNTRVGVGFITWSLALNPGLLDAALDHAPPAVMLSFGDEEPFAGKIKDAGAKLICQIQTVGQARRAADNGADIIVAQGTEGGGHGQRRATLTLVPEVVDAVGDIPVVAAGGVSDGRGLAAALMLGAAGVLMGTRFYATQEAGGRPEAKAEIVAADGDATIRGKLFDLLRDVGWPETYTGRVLRNDFARQWEGRDDELIQNLEGERERYKQAAMKHDFSVAPVIAGEGTGLIQDIPDAAVLVERVVTEAADLLIGAPEKYLRL